MNAFEKYAAKQVLIEKLAVRKLVKKFVGKGVDLLRGTRDLGRGLKHGFQEGHRIGASPKGWGIQEIVKGKPVASYRGHNMPIGTQMTKPYLKSFGAGKFGGEVVGRAFGKGPMHDIKSIIPRARKLRDAIHAGPSNRLAFNYRHGPGGLNRYKQHQIKGIRRGLTYPTALAGYGAYKATT
jgi:hypothetical protein